MSYVKKINYSSLSILMFAQRFDIFNINHGVVRTFLEITVIILPTTLFGIIESVGHVFAEIICFSAPRKINRS